MSKELSDDECYMDDVEKWENGELGCDEEFARVATMDDDSELMKLLDGVTEENPEGVSRMISIRLPNTLISDLKSIGLAHKLGYQTLAKKVLIDFVERKQRAAINHVLAENKVLKNELDDLKKQKALAESNKLKTKEK